MKKKPSYEKLEQKIKDLETRLSNHKGLQLETIFNGLESSFPIGITDLTGKLIYVNESLITMWGYSHRDQIIGRSLPEFWEGERIFKTINELQKRGYSTGEDKGKRKDGSLFDIQYVATLCKNNNGGPEYMLGQFFDISERKKTEDELEKSQILFNQLANNIEEVFWIRDAVSTEMLYLSPGFEKVFGISCQAVYDNSMAFIDLVEKEDIPKIQNAHEKQVKDRKETVTEYRINTPTGEKKWIRAKTSPIFDINGKLVRTVGIAADITERKITEQTLEKSERKYRKLVNTVPFGIQLTDLDGKILFSNPAHHRILGYDDNELIGKYIWDLIADDERKNKTKVDYSNIVEHQPSPETYFNKNRSKDGRLMDTQIDWDYVHNAHGELESLISIISDVTQRKKAEEALEMSESKYRQLIQTASDAIYLISEKGQFIDVNPAACRMLDRSREEILNLSINGVDPNFSIEPFVEFSQGTPLKEPRIFETSHLHKDGTLVPVEVSGQKFKIGEDTLFFGIARNITDRKKSEEELQLSIQKYQSMVDNIGIGVALISPDMEVLELNKQMRKWFPNVAQDHETICYRVFNDPPSDRICDYCPTCKTMQDGKVHESVTTTSSSGNVRNFRIISSPIFDEDGKVKAAIEMVEDITERLKLENQMRQSQKLESIGNLAGGIAHDFNNILASIIGFTELALDDVEKESTIEDNLQEVYAAGKRAKELVGQILAFARQSEEKLKPIQIDIIVKEVLQFIRSTIPTTIEIKSDIASDSLIMGNHTQVHQIIMNLCTNAAHAMEDKGGILNVSLKDVSIDGDRNFPATKIDLNYGDYIKMAVSDTGTGIPPEIFNSIFEPYFTTKDPGEGTGMGLAMVMGIVESYGGKITVDSKIGKGTTFLIYLPVTRKRKAHHEYEQEQLPTGTERIMFVDDEAPIAKMGSQGLERLGYQVTSRTSSVEALELFQSKPNDFNLVITDMTMPNMTGDVLAVELMAIRPDLPVILCTGYSKKISYESATEIGIKAFAYKPIVMADLAKTVRKVLDEEIED